MRSLSDIIHIFLTGLGFRLDTWLALYILHKYTFYPNFGNSSNYILNFTISSILGLGQVQAEFVYHHFIIALESVKAIILFNFSLNFHEYSNKSRKFI